MISKSSTADLLNVEKVKKRIRRLFRRRLLKTLWQMHKLQQTTLKVLRQKYWHFLKLNEQYLSLIKILKKVTAMGKLQIMSNVSFCFNAFNSRLLQSLRVLQGRHEVSGMWKKWVNVGTLIHWNTLTLKKCHYHISYQTQFIWLSNIYKKYACTVKPGLKTPFV